MKNYFLSQSVSRPPLEQTAGRKESLCPLPRSLTALLQHPQTSPGNQKRHKTFFYITVVEKLKIWLRKGINKAMFYKVCFGAGTKAVIHTFSLLHIAVLRYFSLSSSLFLWLIGVSVAR